MPTLTLLRHAKAAAALGQRDIERPLTDRGRSDAARMGAALSAHPYDLALVSAAKRSTETWEIIRASLVHPPPADIDRDLYLCGARMLTARLRILPQTANAALVIGHNPDMQEVALWLAGADETRVVRDIRDKYPTCAAATFTITRGWDQIGPKNAKLEQFLIPADLDG